MTDKRVLIVEDETTSQKLLSKMIQSLGYDVSSASNGAEALKIYKQKPFHVIVTDIEMPVMDGNELINNINEMENDTIIIVQTAHSELDDVIKTMKMGVFDYIIKPINKDDIKIKLKRAFEISELRRSKIILEKEKDIYSENKLDWLTWNETIVKRDYDRIDRALFKSLHTNFNQGAGFGTLLTLINIISQSAKEENGKYIIDSKIFNTLKESAKLAEKALNTFSEINEIINTKFNLKKVSLEEVHQFLRKTIDEKANLLRIKNQNLLLSDSKINFKNLYIMIDFDFLYKAVSELIINALKFSKKDSDIIIILDCKDNETIISIINDPIKNDKGIVGIPLEYENLIFEPFFRLDSHVFEEYDTLDYGLGLTKVEKILEKMQAVVSFFNIKDLTDVSKDPITKVTFSISMKCVE